MSSTNRQAVTRSCATGALALSVVDIPDVAVELAGTGSTGPLRTVIPADEPTLVWF
jgi:hypothetical protein